MKYLKDFLSGTKSGKRLLIVMLIMSIFMLILSTNIVSAAPACNSFSFVWIGDTSVTNDGTDFLKIKGTLSNVGGNAATSSAGVRYRIKNSTGDIVLYFTAVDTSDCDKQVVPVGQYGYCNTTYNPEDSLPAGTYQLEAQGVFNSNIYCPIDTSGNTFTIVDGNYVTQSNWTPAKLSVHTINSANITLNTDVAANCSWSTSDQAYTSMTNFCTGNDSTTQSCNATGVPEAGDVYIACTDGVTPDTADTSDKMEYVFGWTAPAISLISPGNNTNQYNKMTLKFSVADANPIYNCSLYLDGAFNTGWVDGNDTFGRTYVTKSTSRNILSNTVMSKTTHTWYVNCTDYTLSTNNSLKYQFTVLNTAPNTPSFPWNGGPVNNTVNTTSNQPTFRYNYNDIDTDTGTCYLYVGGISRWSGSHTYNTWKNVNPTSPLDDGVYQWYISCNDGQYTRSSEVRTITIDLTTPSITIVYPANTTYTVNVSELNYTFTETEPTCKYSTDGGVTNSSFVTCGTNFTDVTSTEGSNTWTLYVNDTVNNRNQTSVTFWMDTVNPGINFTNPTPSNASTQPNTDVYVNVSTSDTSSHSAFIDWNRSLKLWLKMDEYNASGVFDNSTYNNFAMFDEMTISNIATGIRGNGISFDGADSHLMFMSSSVGDITGNITAITWIKASSLTNNDSFLMKTSNDTWLDGYGFMYVNGNLLFWIINASNNASIPFSDTSSWNHIAGTYDGANVRIYVNGTEGTFASVSGAIPSVGRTLHIGAGMNSSGQQGYVFDGSVDEVMLFDRVLSSQEINATYQAGTYKLFNNFTGLSSGTYNYTAHVIDAVGYTNSTEQRIVTIDAIDATYPTWENNKTNLTASTPNGNQVYFNITLNDTTPANYTFSWYNGTDWENNSVAGYTNGQEIEITKTINVDVGDINWTWYFNDTAGNANQSDVWGVTLVSDNTPPSNSTAILLVSNDTLNVTTSDLNCSTRLDDDELNKMNVTVSWYNNSYLDSTIDHNSSYANGTVFSAILDYANTTKGENWSCSLRIFDGIEYSPWTNSSNLTILNSLPVVTLSTPNDNNVTTNRTPEFTWSATDADNDAMTYQVNITLVPAGFCSDSARLDSDLSTQNYTPSLYLNCFADNLDYYAWTVRANDSVGYGSWASTHKINISAVVTISLPVDNVNFGSMMPDATNDTTDNTPSPILLQNDGNCMINITVNATDLWESIPGNSSYFQFKIDNNTAENYSFNWGLSKTSWTQIPMPITTSKIAIVEMNWSDVTDSAEIDLFVNVPTTEPPGIKSSLIVFTSSLAE